MFGAVVIVIGGTCVGFFMGTDCEVGGGGRVFVGEEGGVVMSMGTSGADEVAGS